MGLLYERHIRYTQRVIFLIKRLVTNYINAKRKCVSCRVLSEIFQIPSNVSRKNKFYLMKISRNRRDNMRGHYCVMFVI